MNVFSHLVVIIFLIQSTTEYGNYNPNRRPQMMGDRIPLQKLLPRRPPIQKKIVLYHNFFRSKVEPSATNMLRMKWHRGAAIAAQKWANQCKFLVHDNATGRHINNYGSCGQNIFIATQKVPWLFAIETWWLEKAFFKYGRPNNLTIVGHYTQMVWGPSHEIGCGIAKCLYRGNHNTTRQTVYYNYVCNYCPSGNIPGRLNRPYRKGASCTNCKKHCKGKLCLNSCKYADYWSNCRQLYKAYPSWVCHTKNTVEGRDRFAKCRATCTCKHKIYN